MPLVFHYFGSRDDACLTFKTARFLLAGAIMLDALSNGSSELQERMQFASLGSFAGQAACSNPSFGGVIEVHFHNQAKIHSRGAEIDSCGLTFLCSLLLC